MPITLACHRGGVCQQVGSPASTAAIVTIVIRLFRYRHLALIREKTRGRSQDIRERKPGPQ
jgi:hypothetical protein